DYLIAKVIEPWLGAYWVQIDLRSSHRDEYKSQLFADLAKVLDRLKDHDPPPAKKPMSMAQRVEKFARDELSHARRHMYASRQQGNRGHARTYSTRRRQRSDKPITSRDDDEISMPSIVDDPTITDRHPRFNPSKYGDSPMGNVAKQFEELKPQ